MNKVVVIFGILLMAVLMSGCGIQTGEQPVTSMTPGIDGDFLPYVSQYETAKGGKINPIISIHFGSMGDSKTAVGLCYSYRDGRRDIVVDKSFWDVISIKERRQLIWHELGHCDLNRSHKPDVVNYKPVSLMYPYVFSILDGEVTSYFVELFANAGQSFEKTHEHSDDEDVIYVD